MHKTNTISQHDAKGVYTLFHEICELGFDPVLWRRHLLKGLNRLIDSQVAIGVVLSAKPNEEPKPVDFFDVGWGTERERTVFLESFSRLQAEGDYAQNPFYSGLNSSTKCLAMSGYETLGTEVYRRHDFFNECVRAAGGEDMLGVCSSVVADLKLVICVHRPQNSRPFSRREIQLAEGLMEEISPSIGSRLALSSMPSVCDLSRRKRQVMLHLLSGLSEKQIAAQMNVSRNTVHEYITAIYRHYKVNDRAELLSRFISPHIFYSLRG